MGEPKAYSLIETVHFALYDSNLMTPKKGDILIKRLRNVLAEFKYQNGYVSGYLVSIGEFEINQKNPNLCLGSWEVRAELVDLNEDNGAVKRFNDNLFNPIHKRLCEIRFKKYQSIIKVVPNFDELGDLSSPDEKSDTALTSDAQIAFYGRFQKAIFDFPNIAKMLVLDKEIKRLKANNDMTEPVKKKLLKNADRLSNSLMQNMNKKESAEYNYFAVSLDLIPAI